MVFHLQPPSALPNAPKYSNPFDVTDGRSLIHVSSVCAVLN